MFNKLLVPLDGSKLAECILPYVEELVKGQHVKEVILFRVCEQPQIPADCSIPALDSPAAVNTLAGLRLIPALSWQA